MNNENDILNELIKPDSRCSVFHITLKSLSEKLEKINLNDNIPKEISEQIRICKKLCLYSYFVYEFATVGEELSYLAIETALKERLRLFYLDGFEFKNLESGLIQKEKPHSLPHFESLLRNDILKFMGAEGFFKRGINMYDLMNWAIEKEILKESFKGQGAVVKDLRNFAAHPSGRSINIPWNAIDSLARNVSLINSLFREKL